MLKLNSRLSKARDIPWKIIEKEAVLVDIDEREVIRLDEVGAEIWKFIDGNNTVEDIINRIYKNFEAEKKKIEKDAFNFLKKLIAMEIVEPCK